MIIPRNHIIEKALIHAMNDNNSEIHELMKILDNPFKEISDYEEYASPPLAPENNYVTYCGT